MQNIIECIQIFEHIAMGNLMGDNLACKISQKNTVTFG